MVLCSKKPFKKLIKYYFMKKLELNQMENLEGGDFWGELTLTGVCGIVGAVAGSATMGVGFVVGFACSAGVLALQHYNH